MSAIGLRATPVSIAALRDRRRHVEDQPRIERHRDDVVRPELQPRAVDRGDLVRHVLARQRGERAGGGDLHLHVDGGGAHVERAAEDEGKAEHVVDLVRIVRAAGRHDGVVAHLRDLFGGDFRIRIGHGEDDRLRRHRLHHVLGHRALDGQAEEHVGALHRVGQRARVGLDRVGRLPLVHALGAALVDHALGVAEDQVLGRKPTARSSSRQAMPAAPAPLQTSLVVFDRRGRSDRAR